MLNLNQLRVFYHAARCQSFTQAAAELFISQPAVTAQIKAFESLHNLSLFRKNGRKLHLTSEGRILYDCVCKIFEYEKEVEKTIDGMRDMSVGMLRVGTTKAYARFFMPHLVSSFHKAYPHVKIFLDEGSSRDMASSLLELKNDVAVIAKADSSDQLQFIPFRSEKLVLIFSPAHPFAKCREITFEQLAREPILMKETGSGTRRVVNALFDAKQCRPNILMETGNAELIKQLVMQGEGVSFLVHAAVALEIGERKLATVPLKGHHLSLDVSIAYLKKHSLSHPAQAFVDMLDSLRVNNAPPQAIGELMGRILATKVHKL